MKTTLLITAVVGLALLAGCTPAAQPGAGVTPTIPIADPPTEQPTTAAPTQPAGDLPPAQAAAVSTLSMLLGVPNQDIRVVSVEEVEWPDACLGVLQPNAMCAQVITPGYRIILETGGKQYEYHTNLEGTALVPAFVDQKMVEQAVLARAADSFRIPAADVALISTDKVEWPNSCLGVEIPGAACAEVITPGYQLVLEAQGRQFEFRSDENGNNVMAATPGLTWTRQGGIAGFDDSLLILQPGDVRAAWSTQSGGAMAANLPDVVSAEELAQFNEWMEQFGKVEIVMEDPATADAMKTILTLSGYGTAQPSEAEKQALLDFAQKLFNQFSGNGN